MKTMFERRMFDSLQYLDRWEPNQWGSGYVVPAKDMEHAADHLIGIYEKFKDNDILMWHLEEVFAGLDIPMPEDNGARI